MARKKTSKTPNKMHELYTWNKRPFLDKMLDDGVSPNQIHKWCVENGFEVSVPTVYGYAKKRKEAIVKGIQLDKVFETNAKPLTESRQKHGYKRKQEKERKEANLTVDKIQSDLQLLDAVMQKGYETLMTTNDIIMPKDFLKAIELKHKITGGSHSGITTYGLEEIRLRENARETAITAVLLEFIPEEKHTEALERMEQVTQEFYDSIGLGEQYEALGEVEEM